MPHPFSRPRPTTAAAVAAVCFAAGLTAGAVYDTSRTERVVADLRAAAAQVESSRATLEGALARAESAAAEATTVASAPAVDAATRRLSSSADSAARAAQEHRVELEATDVEITLPVPLITDGSVAHAPRYVAAAAAEASPAHAQSADAVIADEPDLDSVPESIVAFAAGTTTSTPDPVATVSPASPSSTPTVEDAIAADPAEDPLAAVLDDEVGRLLDGQVEDLELAQEAVARLEQTAAELEEAAREVEQRAEALAEAAAEAQLEGSAAVLSARASGALDSIAAAREDAAAVESQVADVAVLTVLTEATLRLERLAALEADPSDEQALAAHQAEIAAAERSLAAAELELAESHAAWVTDENARRDAENERLRVEYDALVTDAEAARTALYRAAVASHQDGWAGRPDGMNYSNGRLPASELCPLPFAPQAQLTCDAARALTAADDAYHAETGRHLEVLSSYRSYTAQVSTRANRSWLAAAPGRSNHGWGMAVDLDSASAAWLRAHGADFGWVHPAWARPGGSKPESWHLEYVAPGVGELDVPALDLLEPATDLLAREDD